MRAALAEFGTVRQPSRAHLLRQFHRLLGSALSSCACCPCGGCRAPASPIWLAGCARAASRPMTCKEPFRRGIARGTHDVAPAPWRSSGWMRAGAHLGASSVTLRADFRCGSELLVAVGAIVCPGGVPPCVRMRCRTLRIAPASAWCAAASADSVALTPFPTASFPRLQGPRTQSSTGEHLECSSTRQACCVAIRTAPAPC